jgi:signal transduction histidine kinase
MCWAVNLSLERGNSDGSCAAYVQFGCVVGTHFGDYESAYRFGRLGCELVERRGLERFQARTYLVAGYHVIPYAKHVRTARDLLRRGFEIANKSGDLMYMGWYRGFYLIENLLAAGDPLIEVQREAESALAFAQKMQLGHVIDVIPSYLGLVRMLRGLTSKFGSFNDEQFDEARIEMRLAGNPDFALAECLYQLRKLQARFHAGDYAAAIQAASRAERLNPLLLRLMFTAADYHFYSALSQAACCDSAPADEDGPTSSRPAERQQHLDALVAHHRQLQAWAENCPENFENRVALVGAELARIEGRELDAERLYEQAIRSSRANGFVHNEAIAYERASEFYRARRFDQIADLYLRNAHYAYVHWGADGKVRELEQRYPRLREEGAFGLSTATIDARAQHLDLETVMKASQAVSGEILLQKLIETLLKIALEHAGADRGLLILPHGKQHRVEAEITTSPDQVKVQLRQAPVTSSALPESLFRYVIRTQERVILDDATAQNLFSEDEYVRQRRPKSVLCLPLVKQGKLMGVLYLENNLAPGAFTAKRLAMLELLASQAAISLDHARVYAELARENSERKRAEEELRRSESFLAQGQRISHTGSWGWQLATGALYWSEEHFRIFEFDPQTDKPSYSLFMERIHPEDRASFEELLNRAVRDKSDFENQYRIVLPDGSIKFLRSVGQAFVNPAGELEFIGTLMDVTDLKRAEEMQIAIVREREMLVRQRALDLANANEALRSCLDALASVPELDQFVGQVMAVITEQLGAASGALALFNGEQQRSQLELLFQDGRVMSPAEADYPESFRSMPVGQEQLFAVLNEPITVIHLSEQQASIIPDGLHDYFLREGVRTLLIVPLISRGEVNGFLSFRFAEKRDFQAEELEIARALATQASLAIQLTQLAKTAERTAVLEERNQLAGEIHDSLAQFFTGISMQLGAAKEVFKAGSDSVLSYLERALDLAQFGLSEARRSAFSLRPTIIEESGLIEALQKLVERSNIPGRLRCNFHSSGVPEESLPPSVQQDLLRIAQEAMSNAVRHARPTVISVNLRCNPSDIVLEVIDNGSGIADSQAASREGLGLSNMRARAENIGAELKVRTTSGCGTTIVVEVPMNF